MKQIVIRTIRGGIIPPTQRVFDTEVKDEVKVTVISTTFLLNGKSIPATVEPPLPSQIAPTQAELGS